MKPVICLLKSFATLWKGNCAIELMKMHLKGIKLSQLERQNFAIMLTCDQKSCFKLYLWASFPSQLNSTKGTNNKEKLFNVQICIGNSNRGNTGCVCAALIFYSTMKGLTTKINEIVRIFFIFFCRDVRRFFAECFYFSPLHLFDDDVLLHRHRNTTSRPILNRRNKRQQFSFFCLIIQKVLFLQRKLFIH